MRPSPATFAEFYRVALQAGLAKPEEIRAWAHRLIEQEAEPEGEIVEVALCKDTRVLEELLRSVPGERNPELAGKWLLRHLRDKFLSTGRATQWCAQRGMQIVRATALGDDLYYQLDGLDEEAFLEATNPGAGPIRSTGALDELLANFPPLPAPGEA